MGPGNQVQMRAGRVGVSGILEQPRPCSPGRILESGTKRDGSSSVPYNIAIRVTINKWDLPFEGMYMHSQNISYLLERYARCRNIFYVGRGRGPFSLRVEVTGPEPGVNGLGVGPLPSPPSSTVVYSPRTEGPMASGPPLQR